MAERRYTVVFYTAVVTAIAATYAVYRVLEQTREAHRVPTQPVIVAARDVPEGERLDRLALAVRQWPQGTIPSGAFSIPDSLVGRVTRVAVFQGEAIVPGRLAPPGTGPGIEVKIAPGKRAMAVKINDVAGINGLVQPNSRVDVLVTLNDEVSRNKQRAKVFMSNMRVLSVGTEVERGDDGKPINATTATLEVTPDEAERLAVAMNQGTIQLVLRGYGDPASVRTAGATSADVMAQLRSGPYTEDTEPKPKPEPRRVVRAAPPPPKQVVVVTPPPAPPPPPESVVVHVYRADKLTQQKFDRGDSTGVRKSVLASVKGADSASTNPKQSAGTQKNDSTGTSPRP
jgi:pilus assembly protein CpaB